MELWDVYDIRRQPAGRTHRRGDPLPPGDFHLVVHVWFINSKGETLIQKRADGKDLAPGVWAVTAGSALAGEDSASGAARETLEEMGFAPDMRRAAIAMSFLRGDTHTDVWVVRQDVDPARFKLDPAEVSDARWVTFDELSGMLASGDFLPYTYLPVLKAYYMRGYYDGL